jgi:hypothetical protein
MCLRRAPEKYIAGAALDRAGLDNVGSSTSQPQMPPRSVWEIAQSAQGQGRGHEISLVQGQTGS